MAIIYGPSIPGLMVVSGIVKSAATAGTIDSGLQSIVTNNTNQVVSIGVTVYGGTQPLAATILSSWTTYNTSFLFHQPAVSVITNAFSTYSAAGRLVRFSTPTAVTAANTGTASWAILWINANVTIAAGTGAGQISNTTIPGTSFIVCPVTTVADSTGFVLMSSTSVTSGTSATVTDFNIRFAI